LDNDITFLIFPSAWAGVWIFFVLSGFLMGKGFYSLRYKLDNEGIKNFFINRAIQIFPLYFFSIILIAIFVHPEILKLSNIEYLLRLLTFTNDSELPININGALWTISTEVQFYLTVPFLMYLLMLLFKNGIDIKKVVFILLLLLVFGIVIRSSIYHIYDHDFSIWSKYIYKPFFANFDLFLFGMAANFIIPLVSNSIKNYIYNKSALLVLIMLIFFNSYMGYQAFVLNHFSYFFVAAMPSITALLTIYLIVYIETIGIQKAIEKKIEKKKLIHYIGLLTFPIYIWHEPVLLQISKITDSKVYLLNVTVAIVMILIIAVASYFWIENAMNKSKKTD
jgi:peptidoglycan/LPS O-acetylase OafA/YrhL